MNEAMIYASKCVLVIIMILLSITAIFGIPFGCAYLLDPTGTNGLLASIGAIGGVLIDCFIGAFFVKYFDLDY